MLKDQHLNQCFMDKESSQITLRHTGPIQGGVFLHEFMGLFPGRQWMNSEISLLVGGQEFDFSPLRNSCREFMDFVYGLDEDQEVMVKISVPPEIKFEIYEVRKALMKALRFLEEASENLMNEAKSDLEGIKVEYSVDPRYTTSEAYKGMERSHTVSLLP